jgi:hypothetical protein
MSNGIDLRQTSVLARKVSEYQYALRDAAECVA